MRIQARKVSPAGERERDRELNRNENDKKESKEL